MLERSIQDKLHKKAKNIINRVSGNTYGKKMSENDIKNQGEIIQTLISEGMWPAPGGAWLQQCFPFEYDSFNYRVDDYWAYPMETILWGCGDDEDIAILYCAIMKDALRDENLEVALLSMPETTIAAVQLDMSSSFIKDPKMIRGLYHMYTVADTSSDLGLGELRSSYDISPDGRTMYFNGTEVHGRYGITVV